MKSKIKKDTILRLTKALNEINELVKKGEITQTKTLEICARNQIQNSIMTFAVRSGVFNRPKIGLFTSNFAIIEPIHARKIIELRNNTQMKQSSERANKLANDKQNFYKQPSIKKTIHHVNNPVSKKQFSLFWGLIKFNY